MMKKRLKHIAIIAFAVIFLLGAGLVVLFWNELRTLSTLKKVDANGTFQMTYHGDYGFDDFLEVGAKSDADIEAFVTKRLLKGLPINLGMTDAGCIAFVAHNEKGDVIFGRNFDFEYAPCLQLYTKPDNGYASISNVNLSFAGYDEDYLPHEMSIDSFLTLSAPYLPFDGMNEKGVVMALLAVPEADGENNPEAVTLNTTTAIRRVLDKAASVEEAIDLLDDYNIYFSGDVPCHYLIADKSGRSALVEFYDGAMQVVNTDMNYQIASNFIAYHGVNIGEGYTEFERYQEVESALQHQNGTISDTDAISLLQSVGVYGKDGTDKLQWSVLFNLTTGELQTFVHRNAEHMIYAEIQDNRVTK